MQPQDRPIHWESTGDATFFRAADIDGTWWVLRLNGFPEHPMFTLFVDGVAIEDIEATPTPWRGVLQGDAPELPRRYRRRALATVQGLAAYGSERGTPCTDPWCCDRP